MPHSAVVSIDSARGQASSAEDRLLKAQRASRTAAARIRHQVVMDHLALATSIAHRDDHCGLDRQGLEQVALLGLVQAVRRYRPDCGSSFLAFAVPTITAELERHVPDHGTALCPPRQVQEQSLSVRSCSDERSIVRRRFAENLTGRRIGQRIGVSQLQVSRRLADILLRLRRALAAEHDSGIGAAS